MMPDDDPSRCMAGQAGGEGKEPGAEIQERDPRGAATPALPRWSSEREPKKVLTLFGPKRQFRDLRVRDFPLRRCAMRGNLRPGQEFPDIELANDNEELTKVSSLMRGFPTVIVFSRGYY
jgi:hypothetical protein